MRNSEVFFFGKPYRWVQGEKGLELIPDTQLALLFPRMLRRYQKDYMANLSTETALDIQANLYMSLVPKGRQLPPGDYVPCTRCGNWTLASSSIEVDPLCSECMTKLGRGVDLG